MKNKIMILINEEREREMNEESSKNKKKLRDILSLVLFFFLK